MKEGENHGKSHWTSTSHCQEKGNNLGVCFNASIIDKTIIEVDTKVDISVLDDGTIMIKPLKNRKSLNEIIEGLTSDNQGEELIKGTVGEEL